MQDRQDRLIQLAQRIQAQFAAEHMDEDTGDISPQEEPVRSHSMTTRNKQPKSTASIIESFDDNSLVLVLYPKTIMGNKPPTKLHTLWKGPMRVISHVGSRYTVQDLITGKTQDVHITSLKPYNALDDDQAVKTAAKDKHMLIVKAIHGHKRNGSRLKNMRFHVEWEGSPDFTWEPYSNLTLRKNSVLHEYLRVHNLERLIPATFR
jgi:hypothetical protein